MPEAATYEQLERAVENMKREAEAYATMAAELDQSRQIIEGILNALPARVFWKDRDGVFVGCNDALAKDAGYGSARDIVGKTDFDMPWRDQAEGYREHDRRVMESGLPELLIEEAQTTPGGTTITLLTSKVPLRSASGEVTGVLGTYMDISDRKRTEEALERERSRVAAALEQVKTLRGILPICADCKKVRDDTGYWSQVEKYVAEHSEAKFSHGICPDCAAKLYPEYTGED